PAPHATPQPGLLPRWCPGIPRCSPCQFKLTDRRRQSKLTSRLSVPAPARQAGRRAARWFLVAGMSAWFYGRRPSSTWSAREWVAAWGGIPKAADGTHAAGDGRGRGGGIAAD